MPPCLTLSIIRYGSRVKWSNPGKVVAPTPTPRCSSYRKGTHRVTFDNGRQLYIYMCVCVCLGSIFSLMHISLNNIDIFCLHTFVSTRVPSNYGSFINWFPPDTIKSMRQLERTYTEMYRHVYIVWWNNIYIYIYIYIIMSCRYLSLPPTRQDLTQGHWPEGRL